MKRHPRALFRSAVGLFAPLALLFALEASPAAAQELPYQYAVKCICGRPGREGVHFRKKIAVALPSEKAGPVSRFFEARLGPDEALEIDCPDILKHAETERFLKGFVVIESQSELDVVAVYTAAGSTGQAQTMVLERVPPRKQ